MLILIGLRASGKSTLARALAARTLRPHTDLDTLTAQLLNAPSPSDAFLTQGEPAFRAAELQSLRTFIASAQPNHILALGGGTPTIPAAHQLLATLPNKQIIYLRARAQTLQHRLQQDSTIRPSLTNTDPIAEVESILTRRDPLYLALADHVINVDTLTIDETLAAIERAIS